MEKQIIDINKLSKIIAESPLMSGSILKMVDVILYEEDVHEIAKNTLTNYGILTTKSCKNCSCATNEDCIKNQTNE